MNKEYIGYLRQLVLRALQACVTDGLLPCRSCISGFSATVCVWSIREEPTPRHSWHLRWERFIWEQNAVVYFPLGGDFIPACYPSLFAVEAPIPMSILESSLRFSLQTQSQPYPMGKSGNTNWPILVMSRLRILGEYTRSLVACESCLLFAYVDLTELLQGSLWLLPTVTLVYPDSFSLSQIFPALFILWLLGIF